MCNFASMNIEDVREYCLNLPLTEEAMPFDEDTVVFKVGGKMFLLLLLDINLCINVKCDPDEAIELRERFDAVTPGFHMNKRYWNTVLMDGSISDSLLKTWIHDSYKLVVANLSLKERTRLGL